MLEGNQQMTFNMHEQLQEVASMIRIFLMMHLILVKAVSILLPVEP